MNKQFNLHSRIIFIDDEYDSRITAYQNIQERDLVGRQGKFIAEGKVVLHVLLTTSRFKPESILVAQNKLDGLQNILALCPPDVPIYCATSGVINKIAGFDVHRGILAVGQKRAAPDLTTILNGLSSQALVVALCGISNHDNLGSIFRNAAAFEADYVLMDTSCCDPLYRKSIRVSVGAALTVPYSIGGSIDEIVAGLINYGFNVLALSPAGEINIHHAKVDKRMALLLGTEGDGLPAHLLTSLQTARIPMSKSFDSLNVATASGIALARFSNLA